MCYFTSFSLSHHCILAQCFTFFKLLRSFDLAAMCESQARIFCFCGLQKAYFRIVVLFSRQLVLNTHILISKTLRTGALQKITKVEKYIPLCSFHIFLVLCHFTMHHPPTPAYKDNEAVGINTFHFSQPSPSSSFTQLHSLGYVGHNPTIVLKTTSTRTCLQDVWPD